MQEKQPHVEILNNEAAPAFSSKEIEMIDSSGRRIILEEADGLSYYDYMSILEVKDQAFNFGMATCVFLICIKSIDGVEFKKPKTAAEIRAAIKRIGKKKVIDEIAKKVRENNLLSDGQEDKEEIKK